MAENAVALRGLLGFTYVGGYLKIMVIMVGIVCIIALHIQNDKILFMTKIRNSSDIVLFIFSVVPLIPALGMPLYLGIARTKLGYWPSLGTHPDPSEFGWLPLYVMGFVGSLVLALCPVIWLSVLIYEYAYGNKFKANKLSIWCFLLGQILLYVMKFCFTPYFAWYFD